MLQTLGLHWQSVPNGTAGGERIVAKQTQSLGVGSIAKQGSNFVLFALIVFTG